MTAYDTDVLFREDRAMLGEGPTLVDHLDQLLIQRTWEAREASAGVAAIEREARIVRDENDALWDENERLRKQLRNRRRVDMAIGLVVCGILGACAVFG